jgi:hypothetical protein
MSKKRITSSDPAIIRCWLETTQHHIIDNLIRDYVVLSGYHDSLRVPYEIWDSLPVRRGDTFDQRMYRWDHAVERLRLEVTVK